MSAINKAAANNLRYLPKHNKGGVYELLQFEEFQASSNFKATIKFKKRDG